MRRPLPIAALAVALALQAAVPAQGQPPSRGVPSDGTGLESWSREEALPPLRPPSDVAPLLPDSVSPLPMPAVPTLPGPAPVAPAQPAPAARGLATIPDAPVSRRLEDWTRLMQERPVGAMELGWAGCQELWWLRNSLFHQRGYRFTSQRGIAAFGSGGWTSQPSFSPVESRNIETLRALEAAARCR